MKPSNSLVYGLAALLYGVLVVLLVLTFSRANENWQILRDRTPVIKEKVPRLERQVEQLQRDVSELKRRTP